MWGRLSSVVVRIALSVLVVFAPVLILIVLVLLLPSAPEAVGRALFLLTMPWILVALMLVPAALFRGQGSPSGPSDPDDGGGGGGGTDPRPPLRPPGAPRGGIPLPDADQARWRVRGHDRPGPRRVRPRRAAPERTREPVARLDG
jgi:hypothetical protein